jgi:hypothetical protein
LHIDNSFWQWQAQLSTHVQVCAAQRFVPAHWLLLKETLMREVARAGPLSRNDVKVMFRLEPARAAKLHDLAVAQGWIPAKGGKDAAAAAAAAAAASAAAVSGGSGLLTDVKQERDV